jgi:hypothetical protein
MIDLLFIMAVGWLAGNGLCLFIGLVVFWWDGRVRFRTEEDDL